MHIRSLRSVLLLLALASLLTACGDDEPAPGVHVRLMTTEADGPLEGVPELRATDDGVGRRYALESLGDGLYVARDAKPGAFRVLTDTGWGMLWTGRSASAAPLLRGGAYPATLVRMGRPRTLYVAATDPSLPSAPVSERWGAEARPLDSGADDPWERVTLDIRSQGDGMVALGFPAAVWRAGMAIRTVGFMSDGSVANLLSYMVLDAELHALPRLALVDVAPTAPLLVYPVAAAGTAGVEEGFSVGVTLAGVPIEASTEELTHAGLVAFEGLGVLGHGLHVHVGAGAGAWTCTVDDDTWRHRQELHLMAFPAGVGVTLALDLPADTVQDVRVCLRGAAVFARVPLLDGNRVRTYPGWQDVLIELKNGTWLHDTLRVGLDGAAEARERAEPEDACRVRGVVRGAGARAGVRFTRILEARAEPAAADDSGLPARRSAGEGFRAALDIDGNYSLAVPPGRYEIQVVTPVGPRGRPRTLDLRAGADVRLELQGR
ncbi:MAG: hypothetical protein O2894_08690 [Planctomycetota bacterium]|nr:hypothetical protein [Planctomycetota bacterium]